MLTIKNLGAYVLCLCNNYVQYGLMICLRRLECKTFLHMVGALISWDEIPLSRRNHNGGDKPRRIFGKLWFLWNLSAYCSPMATQTMSNHGGSITCSSCQMTVAQSPGTRRTICPFCGNFYNPAQAASVTQRKHERPRPQEDPKYSQVRRINLLLLQSP